MAFKNRFNKLKTLLATTAVAAGTGLAALVSGCGGSDEVEPPQDGYTTMWYWNGSSAVSTNLLNSEFSTYVVENINAGQYKNPSDGFECYLTQEQCEEDNDVDDPGGTI